MADKKPIVDSKSDSLLDDFDFTEVITMTMMVVMMSLMMAPMIASTIAQSQLSANTYNGVYGNQTFGTQALAASSVARDTFLGKMKTILLSGTPALQVYTIDTEEPWVYILFRNTTATDIKIGINGYSDMFTVRARSEFFVDRFNAIERVSSIYYVCGRGQYAEISVKGEY